MVHVSSKFETLNWKPINFLLEIKFPFIKTNAAQMASSYIGQTIWRESPETLQRAKNLETLKQKLKEHYLKELKNSISLFFTLRPLFLLKITACKNFPPLIYTDFVHRYFSHF